MQQINFYQSQFKPKKEILSAIQFLAILGFVTLCLAILSIMLFSFQPDSSQEIDKQRTILGQKQQQLQQLQQKLEQNKENPLLRAELEKLQQTLNNETALLDYVSSRQLGNKNGFSSTLLAFSEQLLEDVWLTEFSLLNAGQYTALKGQTSSAELVPKYIDQLAESEPFKGKTFSVFNLQKPSDTNYFDFELFTSSRAEND